MGQGAYIDVNNRSCEGEEMLLDKLSADQLGHIFVYKKTKLFSWIDLVFWFIEAMMHHSSLVTGISVTQSCG